MTVEFRVLGDVEVRVDGRPVDAGHARQRCVLAALLVDAGRPVSAEQLLDRVWADCPPHRAHNALSGYLSRLRQVLAGADGVAISRQPGGYLLAADPMTVDLHRFRDLTTRAREADDDQAAMSMYKEALGLWRGEPFATLDTPWLTGVRAALYAERLAAELDRNDLVLRLGGGTELLAELTARADCNPLDERLAGQLMLALYRNGRQADALEQYEQLRRRLADELGTDPGPPLRQLHSAILRQESTLDQDSAVPVTGLPVPLTSFIGRDRELGRLRALLATHRLVTVTGVGGAGKSRLALEAARAGAAEHPDGTWLVELAALTEPGLVAQVVAAAIGVREHPRRPLLDLLAARLQKAKALLVLDNCEHLVDEVAELAHGLLATCTGIRILATSRERLAITGEALWPISGLAEADAVRLLTDRATAVDPDFRLHPGTTVAAAQICRRLDGLPLAIELAAASMNSLGVEHIASHLDDRFRLLTVGDRNALARHQTLRAVVDWSYGRLTGAQQRLFNRLAVFAGGFTIDAVEAVCGQPDDDGAGTVGLLTKLVDKSLVAVESTAAGGRRYRLLETLRAYGLDRLRECGEADMYRDRHAALVLTLVASRRPELRGAGQIDWLRQLAVEHGNIRAALAWSWQRGDALTAVKLAGSLYPLWDRHGHYSEGRRWLAEALAMPGTVMPGTVVPGTVMPGGVPPTTRARALDAAAGLAAIQGDFPAAVAAGREAVALYQRAGNTRGLIRSLLTIGFASIYDADIDDAAGQLEAALQLARTAGDRWLEGWSLAYLALCALARGQHARTAALSLDCEAALGPTGDPECLGWALLLRAAAAWRDGDPAAAGEPLDSGLRLFQDQGHLWALSIGLFVAAELAAARRDEERAAVLLGAAEALRDQVGAAVLPFVKPWMEAAVAGVSGALGGEAFDRAWRTGQAMSSATATTYALRQS